MSRLTFDVVIVGAGIVGAACAEALASAGLHVAVVERDVVGSGATAAGMGHLVVMDDSEAQFSLTRYSQILWMKLRKELPSDIAYQPCGTLWIAADEDEWQEVERKYRFYSERDVPVEKIDARALGELEPNLREGLSGALFVRDDAVIYPPCAAGWLIEKAQQKGAKVFLPLAAQRLASDGVLLSDGTRLSSETVVNATGAWASCLTDGVQVRMRKGHLAITDRYPNFIRHQLVELGYLKSAHSLTADSVAFNVQPRSTGQILIGSSRQYEASDSHVEDHIFSRMLRRTLEYMPAIAQTSTVRVWTGFRAATPDKLPFIGPWPSQPGIFLATGHEGLGITTSLATGMLLADQILGRPSAIAREPYLPSRTLPGRAHA